MLFIAVVGGSDPNKEEYKLAEEVGEYIAKAGAVLVCGGLKGCMEAACKGAKKHNGTTIGILPGSRREDANQWVDYPIVTGIGYARNKLVVKTGQVVIAVGGHYGTLSEIAFALGYNIPVVGLKTWTLSRRGKVDHGMHVANTPKSAVELALKLVKEKRRKEQHKREYRT